MDKGKESTDTNSTVKSTTAKDLVLPLRILVSPLSTFKQLATNPTAKGLLSLIVLIIVVGAATVYAFAAKIVLTIDTVQYVDFIATSSFSNWFLSALSSTAVSIALYWLTAAVGLALISRFPFKGSKVISLRVSFVVFGYLLSVFIALYAVRAVIYQALPPIRFPSSTWPPMVQVEIDEAMSLMTQNWTPLLAYQLFYYSAWAGFVWLVVLGTIAIKAMHEVSWFKAGVMSVIGFLLTLALWGPP